MPLQLPGAPYSPLGRLAHLAQAVAADGPTDGARQALHDRQPTCGQIRHEGHTTHHRANPGDGGSGAVQKHLALVIGEAGPALDVVLAGVLKEAVALTALRRELQAIDEQIGLAEQRSRDGLPSTTQW